MQYGDVKAFIDRIIGLRYLSVGFANVVPTHKSIYVVLLLSSWPT